MLLGSWAQEEGRLWPRVREEDMMIVDWLSHLLSPATLACILLQTAQRGGVEYMVFSLSAKQILWSATFFWKRKKIQCGFSSFFSFSRCSWFLFLALRMEIMSHVHGLVLL